MALFDDQGRQIPDPRPVEWPTGLSRPPSLQDEIKRFVRMELSRQAADQGVESFEEADDFDLDEDPDVVPRTAYELEPEHLDRDASDLSKPEPPLPSIDPAAAGVKDVGAGASAPAAGGGAKAPLPPPE